MLRMKTQVLVVIQCRNNSVRLPGKALYPLCGIPMLAFLIRRLRAVLDENEYRIVLATTSLQQDDAVAAWASEEGVQVVRGEENDVLKRYIQCLAVHPSETVVRATADNPLTCPEILKWHVWEMKDKNAEYVQCNNLPVGVGVDVFAADLLKHLDKVVVKPDEREHINLHILRHPSEYEAFSPNVESGLARPDLRMTVDAMEDWLHINSLFSRDEIEPWKITLREAIERMDKVTLRQRSAAEGSVSR